MMMYQQLKASTVTDTLGRWRCAPNSMAQSAPNGTTHDEGEKNVSHVASRADRHLDGFRLTESMDGKKEEEE